MGGRAVRRGDTVSTTIMGCPGNESCRAVVEGVVAREGGRLVNASSAFSVRSGAR